MFIVSGLTLYELLALKAAFAETDRFELIEQIQHEEPPRLKKINDRIPTDLETVIHKAIAHEPAHRYATPRALADDLQRFLRGEPVLRAPHRPARPCLEVDQASPVADHLRVTSLRRIDGPCRLLLLAQHSASRRGRTYPGKRRAIAPQLSRSSRDHPGDARPAVRSTHPWRSATDRAAQRLAEDALGFYERILSEAESNDPVVRADTVRAPQ